MVSVLLADDDPLQLDELARMMRKLRPDWQIVGQCSSAAAVAKALVDLQPATAVLDVRFADATAFEVVGSMREYYPVVYVTGDPVQAADAFTADAVDLVLKPVRPERLEQALLKLEAKMRQSAGGAGGSRRFASSVRLLKGQELVWARLNDVRYFEAQRKYTRVVMKDSEGLLKMGISNTLEHLDSEMFWRIHRSLIVNVAHMASARRDELGRLYVRLNDRNERLHVSRAFEHLFRDGFS